MGEEQEARPVGGVAEETRKKISEGMKASHAKRRKKGAISAPAKPTSAALRQLMTERDALNVAISILQKRGL